MNRSGKSECRPSPRPQLPGKECWWWAGVSMGDPVGGGMFQAEFFQRFLVYRGRLSSEHRILAAALMLPSSSFAATSAARACSPLAPRRPAAPDSWLYLGAKRFVFHEGAVEKKFSTRALILDVRLWRFPPLTVCVSVNALKAFIIIIIIIIIII